MNIRILQIYSTNREHRKRRNSEHFLQIKNKENLGQDTPYPAKSSDGNAGIYTSIHLPCFTSDIPFRPRDYWLPEDFMSR